MIATSLFRVALVAGVGTSVTVATVPWDSGQFADPGVPVRLVLSQARYAPGTTGRVYVRIGRDGYLFVLHAEPDGHVQVAFPLDPADNAAVQAGELIEVRARGGRDAFAVEDSTGTGTWYAALAKRPFRFDSLARGAHWDYRVVPHVRDPRDAEPALTALVQRIASGRFDYDVVQYQISVFATQSIAATGGRVPEPPPPPPPPPDPGAWWPSPWDGPSVWPVPWFPRPWPGPGPFYDRPMGQANAGPPGRVAPPVGDRAGERDAHHDGSGDRAGSRSGHAPR